MADLGRTVRLEDFIRRGQIEFFIKNIDKRFRLRCFYLLAYYGCGNILEMFLNRRGPDGTKFFFRNHIKMAVMSGAIRGGYLEILKLVKYSAKELEAATLIYNVWDLCYSKNSDEIRAIKLLKNGYIEGYYSRTAMKYIFKEMPHVIGDLVNDIDGILYLGARYNNTEILNKYKKSSYRWIYFAMGGHLDAIKKKKSFSPEDKKSLCMWAASKRRINILEFFEKTMDPKDFANSALSGAVMGNHVDLVKYFFPRANPNMVYNAEKACLEIIKIILPVLTNYQKKDLIKKGGSVGNFLFSLN